MAADIRLIATDLDGTLIGNAHELPLYADFRDKLARLREQNQAVWVICTGRTFSSFSKFFSPMRRMGLAPDYVIVGHALIYRRMRFGFIPHIFWNISIWLHLRRDGAMAGAAIDRWHETLTAGTVGVATIRRSKTRLGLRFESEQSAAVAADLLRQRIREYRHLKLSVHGCNLEIRTVPSTKGLALSELANHLGIEREQMLTIGNGANDISMLDGKVSGMMGCPSNSDTEVIETVHWAGGHVARHRALRGVMDILEAYTESRVCSDLPQNWSSVRESESRARSRKIPTRAHQRRPRAHPLVFGGIAYAGILAFACFDVLPFSSWIRLPLDLLIRLFVSLVP